VGIGTGGRFAHGDLVGFKGQRFLYGVIRCIRHAHGVVEPSPREFQCGIGTYELEPGVAQVDLRLCHVEARGHACFIEALSLAEMLFELLDHLSGNLYVSPGGQDTEIRLSHAVSDLFGYIHKAVSRGIRHLALNTELGGILPGIGDLLRECHIRRVVVVGALYNRCRRAPCIARRGIQFHAVCRRHLPGAGHFRLDTPAGGQDIGMVCQGYLKAPLEGENLPLSDGLLRKTLRDERHREYERKQQALHLIPPRPRSVNSVQPLALSVILWEKAFIESTRVKQIGFIPKHCCCFFYPPRSGGLEVEPGKVQERLSTSAAIIHHL